MRRRRALVAAAYVVAVAAGSAAILESVARRTNGFGYRRSDSAAIVFELRESYGDHNAQGFRDRAYAHAKPAGIFRVLGIGDSHTYGSGVSRERVFLKVAEETLNRDASGPHFEVLNLGVPGYNTAMEAAMFEERTREWSPDLVVVQFCRNDFNLPNFVWTERRGVLAHSFALHALLGAIEPWAPNAVKHSVLGYRWDGELFPVPGLEHVPKDGANPIGDPERTPPEYRYMLGAAGVRQGLHAIAGTARARSVPVVFLDGWSGRDADVTHMAYEERLVVLDVWPAMRRHLAKTGGDVHSLWVDPKGDSHPNEEGHRVIGEELAPVIRTASEHREDLLRHLGSD